MPEPFDEKQLGLMADEEQHLLDAQYVAFEDQFRATREQIKDRLRVYLPILSQVNTGADRQAILDLGCGRGEWLELLQEEGLRGTGVDINRLFVQECQGRGFEVLEEDALVHLRKLPDCSVGAVTAFYVAEHLPFQYLTRLIEEIARVLQSGGLALFETPNPANIFVGSCSFYLDPTNQRPLPSQLLSHLVELRGLCRVEVRNLQPPPPTFPPSEGNLAERLNQYFSAPHAYAVIGWKP